MCAINWMNCYKRNIECDVLKCAVDLTLSTERSEGREMFGQSGNVRHYEGLGSMLNKDVVVFPPEMCISHIQHG